MISNNQGWRIAPPTLWRSSLILSCLVLSACANTINLRPQRFDGPGQLPTLAYYQMLSKMNPAELGREKLVLAALPPTPNTQLRQAMLLAYPRAPQDLGKAISLLEGILKASDPASVSLHPVARMLADNYLERQKLEVQLERQGTQLERQGGQLKESQKKAVELQEKIDGLADIERTLPQRLRSDRLTPARRAR